MGGEGCLLSGAMKRGGVVVGWFCEEKVRKCDTIPFSGNTKSTYVSLFFPVGQANVVQTSQLVGSDATRWHLYM